MFYIFIVQLWFPEPVGTQLTNTFLKHPYSATPQRSIRLDS